MTNTIISSVRGRRLWDSRGRPTVEAEVILRGGARGRALAPAGASTGTGEALDLRDGGPTFGGLDVRRAVAAVDTEIAAALTGRDADEPEGPFLRQIRNRHGPSLLRGLSLSHID